MFMDIYNIYNVFHDPKLCNIYLILISLGAIITCYPDAFTFMIFERCPYSE